MEIVLLVALSFLVNILLGKVRRRYDKFSVRWWILIHASIPLIIPVRLFLEISYIYTPLLILSAILGQYVGSKHLTA